METAKEQMSLPNTETVSQSDPSFMYSLLLRTLRGELNRKMFGSQWISKESLEVYCHSGAFLFATVKDGHVTQMSIDDYLYGSISLDEAATEEILRKAEMTSEVKNFIFNREKPLEAKTRETNATRKKAREQEKLQAYKSKNA